ncbi:DNA packaging tegument protein UL17 [Aotine betaherpesvirus 1]|uniref:DNA packaging tegument protein UL17 n=1 Tax=Aotine betaherpesvirus 1 TaxID=50290 RepID=G8XUF8_9BETA|nr:DNA packaging tegument protein UL17 [Aotine betaherpesvirus 1]AEV80788.1 DNA packaging tegument protein UL17 [Aotine betaherpesvirus 1]
METHLFSDLDFKHRFERLAQIPVHVIFDETALTLEQLSPLLGVYYKTDFAGEWQRAPFSVWRRRASLKRYLEHQGMKVGPEYDVTLHHAVFTTLGVPCPERVVSGGTLVYVRFVLRDSSPRRRSVFSSQRQEEKSLGSTERVTVDCEFFARDLLKGRLAQLVVHREEEERQRTLEQELLPQSAQGKPFFEIPQAGNDARVKAAQQQLMRPGLTERYTGGPLEPPSKIRGYELSKRPEVDNPDILYAFGADEARVESWTEEWLAGGLAGLTAVWDVSGRVRVRALWYQGSFWNALQLEFRDDEVDLRRSLETYRKKVLAESALFQNVYRELRGAVTQRRAVRQLFDCFVSADLDPAFLWEMACASLDLWIDRVEKESCIIKALVSCLQRSRGAPDHGYHLAVSGGDRHETWADVIYSASGRVDLGLSVRLDVCPRNGILETRDRDGRLLDWVKNPEVCVIYATNGLKVYWILPGGFGTVVPVPLHGVDLGVLYERFKTPQGLCTERVRLEAGVQDPQKPGVCLRGL